MTTAQLVSLVRGRWGQDAVDSGGVSDLQIVDMLNTAQTELCAESNILPTQWTGSTVNGQEEYSVPSDYHRVQAVFLYQTSGVNAKWPLRNSGIVDRDPRKLTGTPTRYWIWGANVSGSNSFVLGLTPIPDRDGTNDLELWARQVPQTMVSGGQGPEVNTEFQYKLVDGALMLVYARLVAANRNYVPLLQLAQSRWEAAKHQAAEYISPHSLDSPGQIRQETYVF